MRKLLFLVSEDSYFCSHRLNLAKAAKAAGFEVAVATRCLHHAKTMQDANITVFPLKQFNRSGIHPVRQIQAITELNAIIKHYQPDILHSVALKPVILGSLIGIWQKVPKIVNALGGLGYLFTDSKITGLQKIKKKTLRWLVCFLFRWIFSKPNTCLILQNPDDVQTLLQAKCLELKQIILIRGAGIDIHAFPMTPPPTTVPITIVCVARMLWDKGIGELVAAAKILKQQHTLPVEIILYGMPDPENPASISLSQLQDWQNSGIITWKGQCQDVADAYAKCHIAVLPSYREGLPKSLLEAASCGRPIVATDVPGCREIVKDGKNGFLVPAKNANALADALLALMKDESLRLEMGKQSRMLAEETFQDTIIHQQTLDVY